MPKKNTAAKSVGKEKGKQAERNLLDYWHSHVETAMKALHKKFQSDTKHILTESDLKCWLFYYLQKENPSDSFTVHTEVTHYAKYSDGSKEKEKKYKFRDMSLLRPDNIKDAEEIWDDKIDDFVNSKGFKHKGPAIHFELKMVRQSKEANQLAVLKSDIEKSKLI